MPTIQRFTLLAVATLFVVASGCDSVSDAPAASAGGTPAADAVQVDYSLLDAETTERLSKGEFSDAELEARGMAPQGAVFTMSDAADGNVLYGYLRDRQGRLSLAGTFPTGGAGSGDGLNGTSNPIALALGNRYVYAVNGGSDEISAFRINPGQRTLDFVGNIASGGPRPISITVYERLVYVINAGRSGEPGNVKGFRIGEDGSLAAIAGSTQPLNPGAGSPSQIDFSPDGSYLVITDKPTNTITTYPVDVNGAAGARQVYPANGLTTFGFDFDFRNRLIVSEAFEGAADASAASSYLFTEGGAPVSITASERTNETAACWIETFGPFAYATNTGSGSVTGFFVRPGGELVRLNDDGITVRTGEGSMPLDMDIALNYLFVHSAGTNRISVYDIEPDGSLVSVSGAAVDGLPETTVGVAAF
ncbi:MAG: beta-propeller fold lactonase family protein [Bacteroidota bacterium]